MNGVDVLNKYQFEVLKASKLCKGLTQREVAVRADISLGSVNKAVRELRANGYLDDDGRPAI